MERGSEEYIAFYGDDEDIELVVRREEAFEDGIEKGREEGYEQGRKENCQYFLDFIDKELTKSKVKRRLYKEIDEEIKIKTLPFYKMALAEYSRKDEIEGACKEAFDKGFKYGQEKGNKQGLNDMQMYFRKLLLQDLTIEEIKERLQQEF